MPPETSTRQRPSTSFTQSATCSGVMLSRSTRSVPAEHATSTCSGESHSTSTLRPGHRRRARRTAASIDSPPRWLSLTRMPSESEPRWFTPPPARTAAFSRARRPGVVLRVSRMRAWPAAARTKRRVMLATPERWHRKFRAVRSAESTDGSGPSTVAMWAPASNSSPSSSNQVTTTAGSTWANASVAQSLPASTPSSRAMTSARMRMSMGMRAPVTSPIGKRSSAKARATASRTAGNGGCTSFMRQPV